MVFNGLRRRCVSFCHNSYTVTDGSQFHTLLPDVHRNLSDVGDIHPMMPNKLGEPFSGAVLNINVASLLHRDGKDEDGCILLPMGPFGGGELGLLEARLVLELRHADWIFFLSGWMTHFNLAYEGIRFSFVLHSDQSGVGFMKDGNGWDAAIH